MLHVKESVLSLKVKNTALVLLLANCQQVLNIFYVQYYFFDDFGIYLLGYRIEFSCLYIPQRESFQKYVVTMQYR